jgi:hypothetical protein
VTDAAAAVTSFAADVRAGRFPADAESYHLKDEVAASLWSAAQPRRPAGEVVPVGTGNRESSGAGRDRR